MFGETASYIQPKYLFQDIVEERVFGFGVIVKNWFWCNSSGIAVSVNFHIWASLALHCNLYYPIEQKRIKLDFHYKFNQDEGLA